MNWLLKSEQSPETLAELEAILLQNRQIAEVNRFFNPTSPLDLSVSAVGIDPAQVEKAKRRLNQALASQEEVMVFGDYDADGICATAVMWLTLHHLGYKAKPFIPHREKHGYGISHKAIDEILAGQPPGLIITVDNGIVAREPIARLQAAGIDVIVTDHHLPESETIDGKVQFQLPPAMATVHTTQLCGTTVAWMMAKELDSTVAEDLLDFCGIATIADQVPLVDANRSFACAGIAALRTTERVGLKELMGVANLVQSEIDATAINYGLAPRINAMGRLSHGLEALRLLCTSNVSRAQELMMTLQSTNLRRQDLTESMIAHAQLQAETWRDQHLIVAFSDLYHEGVIGLIAGRLMEQYSKPAIVIAVGEVTAKASARSVAGVNIVELIRQVRDDLLEVGGHPMAAGFGLVSEKVELVKQRLEELAKAQIDAHLLNPALVLDCLIPPKLLTSDLSQLLTRFEPFGSGNPEPVVGLQKVQLVDARTMGKTNKHLKLQISHPEWPKPLTAIAWNKASWLESLPLGAFVDVAGMIEINEWQGRKTLQLKLKDIKPTEISDV